MLLAGYIVCLIFWGICDANPKHEALSNGKSPRVELLQRSLRTVLKLPEQEVNEEANENAEAPPRYMLDLYRKYSSHDTDALWGNTVRSIVANRGRCYLTR